MAGNSFGNVGFDYQPAGKTVPSKPNFAKRQKDEYGLKVYADTKYIKVREQLLLEALNRGQKYWSGNLQVTMQSLNETSPAASGRGAFIKLGDVVVGELSPGELREHPVIENNIQHGLAFRGAIEDDLIGFVLKIFTINTGLLLF